MTKAQLAKAVRHILAENHTAARWTAGGYCLRNKYAVHRDGFRISIPKGKGLLVEVANETQSLLPLSMQRKAPNYSENSIFLHEWEHRLRRVQAYCNTLEQVRQFEVLLVNPTDHVRYPYLIVKQIGGLRS